MSARIFDTIFTLLAGFALGYVMSLFSSGSDDTSKQPLAVVTRPAIPNAAISSGTETVDVVQKNCSDDTESSRPTDTEAALPMAQVYRDMIGPIGDRSDSVSAYDLYAAFARDVRDEPWAAAMESGIAGWADDRSWSAEIEFVSCRSRFCVVAGSSPTGSTAFLGSMRDEGWWQAAGETTNIVHSAHDDSADFLLFFSRY